MNKSCLFFAFMPLLAGCTAGPTTLDKNYKVSLSENVSPAMAMVLLPQPAGRPLSVIEKKHANAIEQTVTLQNPSAGFGNNKIIVKSILPGELVFNKFSEDVVKLEKPTEETITEELESEFPNAKMTIAEVFDRNFYGPFGYALGINADQSHCIYAWQFLEGTQRNLINHFDTNVEPTSIRVRLCKPNASQAELIAYIRQMRVTSPGSYALYPVANLGATPTSNPNDYFYAASQPSLRPTTEPMLGAPLALASATTQTPAPTPVPVKTAPVQVKPRPVLRKKVAPLFDANSTDAPAPILISLPQTDAQQTPPPVTQTFIPLPSDLAAAARSVQPTVNQITQNQSPTGIPLPQ